MKFIFALLTHFLLISGQINPGEIHLTIEETELDGGNLQILLFDQKDGFPEDPEKALKQLIIPVRNKKGHIIIKDLKPGKYAITVFHDEDLDGKIKKNGIGYPLDKFGFSNNPSLLFGAPSFEKSSFEVGGKPAKIMIKLR
ncbi:DUF2141 domain-containing protein [Algoriphagus aestuarii]|nr:DUF2141 domain-containing protein [Algoriphagus aestuarii]